MLCGFPPFYDEDNEVLFDKILKCDYSFPSPFWDGVSGAAKDLVKRLLVAEPEKRLDADGILKHLWVIG